ncbi:MAG: ribosome silencing factor [Bacillota bacterium]
MQLIEELDNFIKWSKKKKAVDIVSINLQGITLIGDYFLLMTASNTRQGQAIADYIKEQSEIRGKNVLRVEGYEDARWILLDFGDIIVHIFQEEERKYYNLERLWGDAPIVNH